MRKVLTSLLLVFSTVAILRAQTVVDIIVNSPDHTILETAVITAGLQTTLATAGPFTVFAPTDAAFNALPQGTVAALLADTVTLTNILLYHVLGADVPASAIPTGQSYATSLYADLSIQLLNTMSGVSINQATVTTPNLTAINGVVHVVDQVLLPLSIADAVSYSSVHETLEVALDTTGLLGVFADPTNGNFTLFAPTDDAFDALPTGTVAALLNDLPALQDILLYHAIGFAVPASGVPTLAWGTTVGNGYSLQVQSNAAGVFINETQVRIADIRCVNGIVHVIDGVLLPPTIEDWVATSPIHTTLEAGVGIAGLGAALSDGASQLTLFAPTDAAFADVDTAVLGSLLRDPAALTEVLTYHALGDTLFSDAIPMGLSFAQTLSGYTAQVEAGTDIILDAEAPVTLANQLTTNGVIHVLGAVLIPPTVADIAVRSPVHNTLVTAVGLANLGGTLSDPTADLTVFAPTDAAFDAVDPDVLAALLADPADSLTNVLLYHVLGAQVSADDIVTNNITTATTLQGEDIAVDVTAAGVVLNSNVNVIITDIFGTNGVVHVIDGVLLPQMLSSTGAEPASSAGIVVYPIPADTYTDLRLPSNMTGEMTVDLYDARGAQLDQLRVNGGTTRIDLSTRASGMYYLLIADGEKSYYQPIVVR
ncbi:MAG: fasciclin domain-containing protein [Saprospiraceae bacterium]